MRRSPFGNPRIRNKLFLAYSTVMIAALVVAAIVISSIVQGSTEENAERELRNSTQIILSMVRTAAEVAIKNHLQAIAEKNRQVVGHFYREFLRGNLSEAEAKESAREVLLSQVIGRTGYVFVLDESEAPSSISIVVHPRIQGQDVSGTEVGQKLYKMGKGYVEYRWRNPGESEARDKAAYLAEFGPWRWIIAASSYKDEFLDLVNIDDFRDSVLPLTFWKTGYPYIIDSSGDIMVHPKLKGNLYGVAGPDGWAFIREICLRKSGKIVYHWKNPGENEFRKKLAVFDYLPEYDWIIVSSGYYDEFTAPVATAMRLLIFVVIGAVALVVIVSFLISSSITRPLRDLVRKLDAEAGEDLRAGALNDGALDEVGLLASHLNDYMEKLKMEVQERKLAQRELASALENNPAGIFLVDCQTRTIKWANSNALGLLGVELSEMVGTPCHSFLCQAGADNCPVLDMGREPGSSERLLECPDGRKIPIIASVTVIKHEGKDHVLETFVDLSERKKLEQQLHQAQRMEAIGTLAGGIAHDFNNILAAILGYAELSLRDIGNSNQTLRTKIEQVVNAGMRARELVQQILAFSRQVRHDPKPIQTTGLIRETVKLLRASLPTTIEINLRTEADWDIIVADPTQIQQVVMNLCTNAAHAMREEGGKLEVSISNCAVDADSGISNLAPGPYLILSVNDTGHGIDPSLLGRIFDPYFTTKDKSVGTGLGLAVVEGIVKSFGGAIIVKSELGKGSLFTAYFPVTQNLLKHEVGAVQHSTLPTGKERILFVDDEKALVKMVKEMLESLGYQVEATPNSVEALNAFRERANQYDLIITDMTMPTITGLCLAREAANIRRDIPVILCTGYSDVVTSEVLEGAGIRELLAKPLLMEDLAVTIRRVLDNGMRRRP